MQTVQPSDRSIKGPTGIVACGRAGSKGADRLCQVIDQVCIHEEQDEKATEKRFFEEFSGRLLI